MKTTLLQLPQNQFEGFTFDLQRFTEPNLTKDSDGAYLISSVDDLNTLAAYVNDGGDTTDLTFKQTQDITFTEADGNFTAIGNNDNRFKGTYDGGNFTISNLTINGGDYQGLFGYVDSAGTIKDVNLVNAKVSGTNYVGGLVGYNYEGTIKNCTTTGGSVTGTWNDVGGLVGESEYGTIENCTSTNGRVSGINNIGGIVGFNRGSSYRGKISGTVTGGSVSGTINIGGLVGSSYYGTVSGTTSDSEVKGYSQVGGLVGENYGGTVNGSSIDNVVSGTGDNVGSFVGTNSDSVSGYYHNATDFKGAGTHTDIYLLTLPEGVTATGNDNKLHEIGDKYYAEAGASITLINNTLSLKGSDNQSVSNNSYTMPAQDSVLFLSTATLPETISTDEGTLKYVVDAQGIPYYAISSVNDLKILSAYVNAGNDTTGLTFKQTQDITFDTVAENESNFTPIGGDNGSFSGTFDGDNHTISNLTINNATTDWQGLFGYVDSNGKIQNLTLSGVNIVTNQENVAAVAGTNHGTIQNCTVTDAVIIGKSCVGALAGANGVTGQIINNTVNAQVAGNGSFVGALVGLNYNEVTGNNYTSNLTEAVGSNNGGTVSNNTVNGTLTDPEIPDGLFSGNDEPVNPQPTFNGQFVQNGNNVQLVDNDGNVLLELAGAKDLTVDDNIYGNNVWLFATNFAGNNISVVSNAGGFNFGLSEDSTNEYIGSLSGKTFVGNGGNILVAVKSVTVDVSKGNNTIELYGGIDEFSVTGFGAGDAIELSDWMSYQGYRILNIQQQGDGVDVTIVSSDNVTSSIHINGLNADEVQFSGNDEPVNPQPTFNGQFVQNGNNVQLVDNDGNVLLELAGAKDLTVSDNVFGNNVWLFATNFAGNNISVVSNAGGFNFGLSEDSPNGYVGSLSGKTFVGNGDNILVGAEGVTIDVSKGNNTIELYADTNEFSVTSFGAGDAIELSDWSRYEEGYRIVGIEQNEEDGTATVMLTDGEDEVTVSINGLNVAEVQYPNNVHAYLDDENVEVYKVNVNEAGALFDGGKIIGVTEGCTYKFWDGDNLETLFYISGMKDNATFNLLHADGVDRVGLFLNAQYFTSNVNVNNNAAGYDIVLQGELSDDIDSATFTASDGNELIQNFGVNNLKIYGGKGADEFLVTGANETIMDYEAADRIIVEYLDGIVSSEVSGNDVIFRTLNEGVSGQFTVKDAAKPGGITLYDWRGYNKTFEFEANEFNNDDPSKATSVVVNGTFGDFGTGQFEKMYSITSAQDDAMIVGNANNNTIVISGGSENILIGGLGKDTYSFNDGGGVIADYGIGATKKGNGTALATSTTAANFDRTDPTSYAGEVDVVKVQGTVNGIYFKREGNTKKDDTFTATITYTDGDGNNELIVLKDIVKKPTKTGASPIYQTNDVAAATLKIWDTSGSKQAVLSAAKLKKLFKDDDYLSAEQQEQADYLYELAERENIVTTQNEESTFVNPQFATAISNGDEPHIIVDIKPVEGEDGLK